MREFFKHILLIAAVSAIFASCQKSEEFDYPEKVILNITADIGQTRSAFGSLDGNEFPSTWSGKENLKALLVNSREDYSSAATYQLARGKKENAELKFAFDAPLPASGHLYICSPAESVSIDAMNEEFVVTVPTSQIPATNSVDPKAHILTAKVRNADLGADIPVTFEHAVSYGKMTITNLATDKNAVIDHVELTIGQKTYTLNATNVVGKVFWFACDANGSVDGFKLTIVDANQRKYVKSTTKKIEFSTGSVTVFSVNMSGISGWTDLEVKPLGKADNIVVAHRGAYKETGYKAPHNSLASLRNAITLGCYGSECDIYWTKDDNVIVAHADSECKINGLYPWENTVAQLRSAGKLSNGEELPTLQDYIEVAVKEGVCTKLILDIKNITDPTSISASTRAKYCINACKRAIEIAQTLGATEYIEFICTSNESVWNGCFPLCEKAKIEIGWMANKSASTYKSNSKNYNYAYHWANLSLEHMNDGIPYDDDTSEKGSRTISEFVDNGIAISVYNVDTDAQMTYYVNNASKLRCICSNYPKKLLEKMGKR